MKEKCTTVLKVSGSLDLKVNSEVKYW